LQLFAAAAARRGDPLIALHVAERVRFGGLASFAVGSQNTIADAVRMQSRMQRLLLGADAVSVREEAGGTWVTIETGTPAAGMRHLSEYCVASSCRLMRWLTAQAARPSVVLFRHQPAGGIAEYERVFGCRVRFGMPDNGALLSPAAVGAAVVSADDEMAARWEQLVEADAGSARATMREAVIGALRAGRLQRAACARDAVAHRLGISGRTLQRRLADEGTSFAAVLEETRRQVALTLIVDLTLSVVEVSRGAGYADQFAFNKAFRRWTGRSPSVYRTEVAGGKE
jgi:AraC-like DNA-binding protein